MTIDVLTAGDLRDILTRVTYRPGWTFEIREDRFEGPMLRIRATVENSYRPGETIDLGIDSFLPPLPDRDAFLDWLLWRLQRVESHEGREWLRYDGVLVSDPHGKNGANDGTEH